MLYRDRIEIDPNICSGKPVIRGTRVLVTSVLSQLAARETFEQICKGFPGLTNEDIQAAVDRTHHSPRLMHELFLDQNVRVEIAEALRQDGHKVIHASDENLGRREDEAIFRWATEQALTIVTFDADFAERAYWRREPHYGVVRLRLEPQTPAHVLPVLRRFLASCTRDKLRNALAVVTENKVRLRRP